MPFWKRVPRGTDYFRSFLMSCGVDLCSRMKYPECSVAAVGSHISAEDNGWKLYEVRTVFADRDEFVAELLGSSFCGNDGRFPGRLIGRCHGEEVECREHGFAR